MTPTSAPAPSDRRLLKAFEARLREVELVGARIMKSWAQAAELSLPEARLLLVVASAGSPRTASELAAHSDERLVGDAEHRGDRVEREEQGRG